VFSIFQKNVEVETEVEEELEKDTVSEYVMMSDDDDDSDIVGTDDEVNMKSLYTTVIVIERLLGSLMPLFN
jgi:hypothetical protein